MTETDDLTRYGSRLPGDLDRFVLSWPVWLTSFSRCSLGHDRTVVGFGDLFNRSVATPKLVGVEWVGAKPELDKIFPSKLLAQAKSLRVILETRG